MPTLVLMLALGGVGQYLGGWSGDSGEAWYSYGGSYVYATDPFGGSVDWVYGSVWRRSRWDVEHFVPYPVPYYHPWVDSADRVIWPSVYGRSLRFPGR